MGGRRLMAWAKLDDQFAEHPRIVPLGDRAFRLHVAAICLSNRKLTDGHISSHDERILMASVKTNRRHTDELVDQGVWKPTVTAGRSVTTCNGTRTPKR